MGRSNTRRRKATTSRRTRPAYERFVHLIFVGGAHVTNIVIGLAIGATTRALACLRLQSLFSRRWSLVHGLMTGARVPSGVMVVIALIALALTAAGSSPAV